MLMGENFEFQEWYFVVKVKLTKSIQLKIYEVIMYLSKIQNLSIAY